ncbi:MAG: tRNA guanosine(34) transglycosylase Tgt [Nanoarchaeota archaeon]
MFSFIIQHRDKKSQARTGIISTPNGTIRTPAFIPVATQATVKSLTPQQLNEIGFDAILCNTYHLYLRPGPDTVKKLGGLQSFMGWGKPTFTDSGGFQVFSLKDNLCTVNDDCVEFKSHIDASKHLFTPEKSMQIQRKLGADIVFVFDQCLAIGADEETTKISLARTNDWEKRSLKEFTKLNKDGRQALYGIVQGGRFKELREKSAKFVASLPFHGIGIGSIFGDPKEESRRLVKQALKFLPYEKPKHLLGIGAVDDLFTYSRLGLDTFDCVLPTRLAREGYIFIGPKSGGRLKNKFMYRIVNNCFKDDPSPLDKHCPCYVCANFSKGYIRHLSKANEYLFYTLATYHNLFFFNKLMEDIRTAIEKDRLLELHQEWIS